MLKKAKKQNVFLIMTETAKTWKYEKWVTPVLLTAHFWFCVSGYISYLQAKHQLISPLIPQKTILTLIEPNFYSALIECGTFIISFWFFVFKKKWPVYIISGISIAAYELLLIYASSNSS